MPVRRPLVANSMLYKYLLTSILSVAVSASFAQNQLNLEGIWELDSIAKHETPSVSLIGGKDQKVELRIYFQPSGLVDIEQNGSKFKASYLVKDSILIMGSREYVIDYVSENRFIYHDANPMALFAPKHYFSKSDEPYEVIPEVQRIEKTYPDGSPKTSGYEVNGFTDGIWIEWFPNGRVQSVSHWKNELRIMTVEFDSAGAVVERIRFDFETGEYITE